jgi:DNA-binding MurR/RpiR family transcriptional regulator
MVTNDNTGPGNGDLIIKSMLNSLKPAEKRVAEYILENINQVIHLSITKLAENAGVSEATVVKFCQRAGFTGYQELKINLARLDNTKQIASETIYDEIDASDNIKVVINKLFQIYNHSFEETKKLLEGANIEECIKMITEAKRLYLFGYGASGIVALDAELKFKRINHIAEALLDNHNQKTVGSLLSEGDLVIAISDSGRTRELVEALEIVRETGAGILVITSNLGSPVTDYADQILITSSKETPFRGSALASRMAQLAVIDLLFLGVAIAEYDQTLESLEKTRKAINPSRL